MHRSVFGEGEAELMAILRKAIPGVTITPEADFKDDEFVKPEDIPWFREIRDHWHPGDREREALRGPADGKEARLRPRYRLPRAALIPAAIQGSSYRFAVGSTKREHTRVLSYKHDDYAEESPVPA